MLWNIVERERKRISSERKSMKSFRSLAGSLKSSDVQNVSEHSKPLPGVPVQPKLIIPKKPLPSAPSPRSSTVGVLPPLPVSDKKVVSPRASTISTGNKHSIPLIPTVTVKEITVQKEFNDDSGNGNSEDVEKNRIVSCEISSDGEGDSDEEKEVVTKKVIGRDVLGVATPTRAPPPPPEDDDSPVKIRVAGVVASSLSEEVKRERIQTWVPKTSEAPYRASVFLGARNSIFLNEDLSMLNNSDFIDI